MLKNRDGTDSGGGTQVVVSVGANSLRLSGNFSGVAVDGMILAYANASSSTTTQRSRYAYMADRATQTISG